MVSVDFISFSISHSRHRLIVYYLASRDEGQFAKNSCPAERQNNSSAVLEAL